MEYPIEIKKIINILYSQDLSKIKLYLDKNTLKLFDNYDGKIFPFIGGDSLDTLVLEYVLSLGTDPNTLYLGHPIIFHFIEWEYEYHYDSGEDYTENKVRLLVEHGANINYICNYTEDSNFSYIKRKITPLDMALFHNHTPAINYLKNHGAKTTKELEEDSKE